VTDLTERDVRFPGRRCLYRRSISSKDGRITSKTTQCNSRQTRRICQASSTPACATKAQTTRLKISGGISRSAIASVIAGVPTIGDIHEQACKVSASTQELMA